MDIELTTFIADADAFAAAEAERHFGDRHTHHVIAANAAIWREHPASEDFNGEPVASYRTLIEAGSDSVDLGREYHVPEAHRAQTYQIRNLLIATQN